MFELSLGWLAVMIDVSLKGLLLAGVTGALLIGGRIRSSSLKHAAWLGVLAAMLGLPLLAPVLPAIPVPLPTLPESWLTKSTITEPVVVERPSDPEQPQASLPEVRSHEPREFDAAILVSDPQPVSMPEPSVPSRIEVIPQAPIASLPEPIADVSSEPPSFLAPAVVTWPAVLAMIWMIGALLLIARLAWSIGLTGRLVQRATPIQSTELLGDTVFSFRGMNQRPVSLRESDIIFVPMTTGWIRPYILLPSAWQSWTAEKLGHVLVHEFAHVRRGDCWTALAAELVTCIYWFHPLAWWLRRRLSVLAEECCDDAAVAATGDRTGYARHLLEIASLLCGRGRRLHYAGLAMARRSQVERRILTILDGNRPLSQRLTWSATLLIAALILPLVALAAALKPAEETSPDVPAAIASDGVDPESDTVAGVDEQPVSAEAPALEDDPFHYAGTVVDEEGKSVPNAEIVLQYTRKSPLAEFPRVATSDQQGRFEFTLAKADFDETQYDLTWGSPTVLARKDGYGIAGGWGYAFETTGRLKAELMAPGKNFNEELLNKATNVLTLVRDDVPLRGRILNIEGKPVAGALVETLEIWEGKDGTLNDWHRVASERGSSYYTARNQLRWLSSGFYLDGPRGLAIPVVKTDADGWFTLKGLGKNRIAQIAVSGETIETVLLHVRSESGETIKLPEDAQSSESSRSVTFLSHKFTQIVGPSVPVEGRVVDLKTGQPLAGVVVRANKLATNQTVGSHESRCIQTRTDDQGRYRLAGLPFGSNDLIALPSRGSWHLPGTVHVKIAADARVDCPDLNLIPGVRIRGRVIDEQTGKPIKGGVSYFAFTNNPFLKEAASFRDSFISLHGEHRTDDLGNYEIAVLPGRGILTFDADDFSSFPRGVGAKQIEGPYNSKIESFETEPVYCGLNHHNFLTPLDLTPDAEAVQVDLNPRSGVEIVWQVFDPEGQPIHDFYFYGEYSLAIEGETGRSVWRRNAGDRISIKGYVAGQGRRLMFYHPERNLVGIVPLSGPPPEKLSIPWQPAAMIHGRLVDPDGKPLKNAVIVRGKLPSDAPEEGVLVENGSQATITDDDGQFELRGIIPGLKYQAKVRVTQNRTGKPQPQTQSLFTDLVAEPGETKNLDDIKIDPAQPEKENVSSAKSEQAQSKDKPTNSTAGKLPSSDEDPFRYAGTVVDDEGKPVANAEIVLEYPYPSVATSPDLPQVTASDEQGRFEFTRSKADFADTYGKTPWSSSTVIARKDGYGIAGKGAYAFETTGQLKAELMAPGKSFNDEFLSNVTNVLKLPRDDAQVRGRILNIEGKPVAGAKVETIEIREGRDGTLKEWHQAAGEPGATGRGRLYLLSNGHYLDGPHGRAIPIVQTDAEGWFTLKRLGRNRMAQILVSGENIESVLLEVRSERGEAIKLPANLRSSDPIRSTTYLPQEFTQIVGPSTPVAGRVVDQKTGEPLANVLVRAQQLAAAKPVVNSQLCLSIHATTDAQGRYRLTGLPFGSNVLIAQPPLGSRYLPGSVKVTTAPNGDVDSPEVKLTPGVLVRGRVIDERMGRPVSGKVNYFAFNANPFLKEAAAFTTAYVSNRSVYHTDHEGNYEIPVLPGKGILAFDAEDFTSFPRGAGAKQIDGPYQESNGGCFETKPGLCVLSQHSYLAPLDLKPDADAAEVNFNVRSGLEVAWQVFDTDGRPLRDFFVYGESNSANDGQPTSSNWHRNSADRFAVKGYLENPGRQLMFFDPQRNLVGVVQLSGPPPKELSIPWQPGATIQGRIVDTDGTPLKKVAIIHDGISADNPQEGVLIAGSGGISVFTDDDGKFELRGIVPGLKYAAMVRVSKMQNGVSRSAGMRIFTDLVAEPGETKNLGDVKFDPSPPRKKVSEANPEPAPSETGHRVHGRVTTENGQPIAGGAVAVVAARVTNDRGHVQETLVEGTTDQAGNYDLTVRDVDPGAFARPMLFVRAAGRAIVWQAVDLNLKDSQFDLKLDPEELIQVRLIDIQGQPAAGVTANYFWVIPTDSKAAPPKLTSDKNGLLTIPYIAAGKGLYLKTVGSEKFAPQSIGLNTGWPETREKNDGTYRGIIKNLKSGEIGTLTLAPARIFEGVVLLGDSGKPAAHAKLEMWASEQDPPGSMMSIDGETDENGRFRLNPYPGVQFGINAYPPAGAPYQIRQLRELRWETGDAVRTIEIRLPAATLAQGTIIDAETGRPLAQASVQYFPNRVRNKSLMPDVVTGWQGMQLTDDAGKFQIAVAPGPGTLLVHAPAGTSYVLQEKGGQELNGYLIGGWRHYAHAFQQINPLVPQDDGKSTGPNQTPPLTISLQPGGTVTAKLLDDKGQPIQNAVFTSILQISPTRAQWQAQPQETKNGLAEFRGVATGRKYPVFILNVEQKLGARAEISLDDPQPTIVLKPCATAKARFIDAKGKPAKKGNSFGLSMIATPGSPRFTSNPVLRAMLAADEDFSDNFHRAGPRPTRGVDANGIEEFLWLVPGAT